MEHYKATLHDLSQRYHTRRLQVKCKDKIVSANIELEKVLDVEFPTSGKHINTTTPYLKNYFRGSEWFIMTKIHALYIIKNFDIHFLQSVKHTFNPHETLFHTMLANSIHSGSLTKYSKRVMGLNAGPVSETNQNITIKHWNILKRSSSLYARKVVDLDLAECISKLVT